MDAVHEVKSRLNIEDVVSEYVQLKRAGRNFKGLSPFTSEKTPSFIVSPDKQIWHDFSSGRGGDVISFVQAVEGLDFRGALELLARKAGVDLAAFQNKPSSNNKLKERLYQAVEAAVSFYQYQLTKNEAPLRYARVERGYEKQTLIDFRFGYAPASGRALLTHLSAKGFSLEELEKGGLITKRRGEPADMFRNRLMIPLSDDQGRPVGFTARQLSPDPNAPKYINTPATLLYDKSRQLFGLSQAKEHIRKAGYVVVVEGNLDVVASHQAGVKQVVASAGTALTIHHLKTLQRFTGDIRLAFDEDRAGQEAAERTIPLAQGLGIELNFIKIPSGKDPDELIKQDVKLWQSTVEAPLYMVDWLLEKLARSVDLTTAPGKRQFTDRAFAVIQKLQDTVEQEHYLRRVAEQTKTSFETLQTKFTQKDSAAPKRLKKVTTPAPTDEDVTALRVLEQHFLALSAMLKEVDFLSLLPKDLFSEEGQQVLELLVAGKELQTTTDYGKMLALLFEETYQHSDISELRYQRRQLARRLVSTYSKHKKAVIQKQLEQSNETTEQELLRQVAELEIIQKKVFEATK